MINQIKETLLKLDRKKAIKFIILFGSVAKKTNNSLSDIDLAVYYEANPKERFSFRIKALGELPDKVDLHLFQDLPLTVQKEVLAGKLIYYTDNQFVFSQFMKIIKEYGSFEKYYDEYFNLEMRKCAQV